VEGWRHSQINWAEELKQRGLLKTWVPGMSGEIFRSTLFNGMLYLILSDDQIAEVDVEGKTQRIISAPPSVGRQSAGHHPIFIGQSQGRLHCINEEWWTHGIPSKLFGLHTRDFDDDCLVSIWVLDDCDTQKWVLKHSVSWRHLFGSALYDVDVVAIHPDSNFVFIFLKQQLMSYGLDSKEVRAVSTPNQGALWFTPYVPCFLDFLSVTEHEDKLMGCGETSTKDGARVGKCGNR